MIDPFAELHNKTVLITGASGSIGSATARLFARYDAFCWIHYNKNEKKGAALLDSIRQKGGNGRLIQANLQKKNNIAALVDTINKEGTIDILVNNSGIIRDSLLIDMKESAFQDVTDINLLAPFILIRELGKTMMKNGSGKIINVSSVVSHHGGVGQGNYAAAKAGLEELTRIAAIEMGRFGVNVNAVAPGITRTNMTAPMMDKFDKQLRRRLPLRRFAEPQDIAEVILFLASSMADYITGQTITVDGGLTL